jgi:hypothetical protein
MEAVDTLSFMCISDQQNVLKVSHAMVVKAAWLVEVRINEKSKLLWMNNEALCDFTRINRHVRDRCSLKTTVEWLLDCGFSQSQISQSIAVLNMTELTLANKNI